MTTGQYESMADAYTSIDLDAVIRQAAAWNNAAGDRMKTFTGMGRFLTGWLSRANDKAAAELESMPQPAGPTQEQIDIATGKSNG
jgi:hypothetical protein